MRIETCVRSYLFMNALTSADSAVPPRNLAFHEKSQSHSSEQAGHTQDIAGTHMRSTAGTQMNTLILASHLCDTCSRPDSNDIAKQSLNTTTRHNSAGYMSTRRLRACWMTALVKGHGAHVCSSMICVACSGDMRVVRQYTTDFSTLGLPHADLQ